MVSLIISTRCCQNISKHEHKINLNVLCVYICVTFFFFFPFPPLHVKETRFFFLCLLHCDTSVHTVPFLQQSDPAHCPHCPKTVQFYLHKCGPACVCVFERKENIFCEMHSFIFGTVYQPGLFPRRKKQSDLKRFALKLPT